MDNKVLKEKLFEAVKQKGLITEQANSGKKDFTEMLPPYEKAYRWIRKFLK